MSLEGSYRSLLTVYRIFAIAHSDRDFNFNQLSQGRTRIYWQIVVLIFEYFWLICVLTYEFCVFIPFYDDLKQNIAEHELTLYIAIAFLTEFSYFIILIIATIESYCQRNVQVQILSNLNEIDRFFATKLNWNINYNRLKYSIQMNFIKLALFYIIGNCVLVWFYADARSLYNLYQMTKEVIIASKYITFAILIRYRIEAMHRVLSDDFRWAVRIIFNRNQSTNVEITEFQRIIDIWQIFCKLFETVQSMNESFKWTISLTLSCDIFSACVELFRLLHYIYGPPDRFYAPEFIAYLVYLIIDVIHFSMFVHMANCVAEEADNLAKEIHRLKSNCAVSEELQNFVSKIDKSMVET